MEWGCCRIGLVGSPVLLNGAVVMTARECLVHYSWVELRLDSWLLVAGQDVIMPVAVVAATAAEPYMTADGCAGPQLLYLFSDLLLNGSVGPRGYFDFVEWM